MIRVLIVDDHALVREGLKLLLSQAPDMLVQSFPYSSLELHTSRLEELCDVLVLDVTLIHDGKGLDMLKRIRQLHWNLPVLVISVHSEEECGIRAFKAGAAGYITTSTLPEEATQAVRRIAQHGRYISSSMAEALAQRLGQHDEEPPEHILSTREFEVFLRLACGERPTNIARSLRLSIKTISTYRSRILEKLHLKTNCQLVYYALQRDLLSDLDDSGSVGIYHKSAVLW